MLRTRILFGVAPLIILLMIIGGYAVWLFVHLGGAVNTTLRENYISIAAMRDLKEAALRIDSALNLYQAGAASLRDTRALVSAQGAACRSNVETELHTITEPGEQELADRLKARTEEFLQAATASLAGARAAAGVGGPLSQVLDAALAVQQLNESAMSNADRRARETAARSTQVMLIAIALALPLGVFFAYSLSRAISKPIATLTASAREMGEGNLDQVLEVGSKDEIGQLADAFNKMAGKLRAYRQDTADEILQARQATEATFAALPDPIVIFARDGHVAYQNAAAERLRNKLNGGGVRLPVTPLALEVLRGAGDYLPESFDKAVCVRVDDREKFLLPRVIGFRDGSGAVAILQDVTRFRLLDDVKTNLVATVSHELKTPLTSIRMAVYLLLEERIGGLNPKQVELLMASRDDAERLLDLINNLLDLARLESGAAISERRACLPDDLIRGAVEQARETVLAVGLKIVNPTDPNLPPVLVTIDQIGHVFSNLISNASKHSPPGEEITVSARYQAAQDAVRFSVIDRGPGVPEAERERIFEKFYRLPGEPRDGAGLGLAICKEIVKAHDGVIGVTAAPGGRGSEFYFLLPVQAAVAVANEPRAASAL